MGKKDKDNNKDFTNNPFSALKGLSVSRQQVGEKEPDARPPAPEKPVAEDRPEADVDFADAMAGLGVSEIERDMLEKGTPSGPPAERTADSADATEPERDTASRTGGARQAQPRRDRQLKRGMVKPEAELDLHGLRVEEALHKTAFFLENAIHHGFKTVRIITGQGHHSQDGPVLRPQIEAYLNGAGRQFVVEWLPAPKKHGGQGAIIAFLR